MTNNKQTLNVNLNPNTTINALLNKIKECSNCILFGLQTAELVNEIPPEFQIKEDFFRLQIGENEEDIEIKRKHYKNWLIKKGFEDLVKGIESSLREAYFYVTCISEFEEVIRAKEVIKYEDVDKIRKKALTMHIPTMIEKIETHLDKPLDYKQQILSINKGRNCLVHRGGVVIEKDINDKIENTLKLKWVKFKFFYEKDGEEIEVFKNAIIGSEGKKTTINMKKENKTISFKMGEHIVLNYNQFNEFIVTCYYFGMDLVKSLPKLN